MQAPICSDLGFEGHRLRGDSGLKIIHGVQVVNPYPAFPEAGPAKGATLYYPLTMGKGALQDIYRYSKYSIEDTYTYRSSIYTENFIAGILPA
jgi:hypothetical protein